MIEVRGPITRERAQALSSELANEAVAIVDRDGAVVVIVSGALLLDIYDAGSRG